MPSKVKNHTGTRCKYLDLSRWLSGELRFWKPGTHNVEMYDKILQGWVKRERQVIKFERK